MKIYLAGPMRGYDLYNFPAFHRLAAELRRQGHEVISPAEMDLELGFDPAKDEFTDAMLLEAIQRDVDAILKCDAIAMMPGWEGSTGARTELAVACWARKAWYSVDGQGVLRSLLLLGAPLPSPAPPTVNAPEEDILDEAKRLTSGDRNASYGDPLMDFTRTAEFWTTALRHKLRDGERICQHEVAVLMSLLKISRLCWSPAKRDNWADLAGYTRCGWRCVQRFILGRDVEVWDKKGDAA